MKEGLITLILYVMANDAGKFSDLFLNLLIEIHPLQSSYLLFWSHANNVTTSFNMD